MKCCLTTKILTCVIGLILQICFPERAYALNAIVSTNENAVSFAKEIASTLGDEIIILRSTEDPRLHQASLIITIGDDAYRNIPDTLKVPVIASFITYNAFYSSKQKKNHKSYAIFMEPDPRALESEITSIFGKESIIGYIFGEEDFYYRKLLNSQDIHVVGIPVSGSTLKSLNSIYALREVDGFYISDNREIFNRSNILLVLESLYRNGTPAITSNKSLEGRGSVLTVYVSFEEIIRKTVEVALTVHSGGTVAIDNFGSIESKLDRRLAQKVNLIIGRVK